MSASCGNCAFGPNEMYCQFRKQKSSYRSSCAHYQPDPEYQARVRMKYEEESWRKREESRRSYEEECRRKEEERRREEEERRRKEERRRHYEEVNGEPYTPVAVRAALGIAAHFFKK